MIDLLPPARRALAANRYSASLDALDASASSTSIKFAGIHPAVAPAHGIKEPYRKVFASCERRWVAAGTRSQDRVNACFRLEMTQLTICPYSTRAHTHAG